MNSLMGQRPPGLPEQAYLIAYDPGRKKLVSRATHPILVRAAVLVELTLRADLVDDDGRAAVRRTLGRAPAPTGDRVLDGALLRIAGSKPRSWLHWVGRDTAPDYAMVREGLVARGVIRLEESRTFGPIRRQSVTVRDTRTVRELTSSSRRVLLAAGSADLVAPRESALATLAVVAGVPGLLSAREQHQQRERIAALIERAGPAAPAMHAMLRSDGGGE